MTDPIRVRVRCPECDAFERRARGASNTRCHRCDHSDGFRSTLLAPGEAERLLPLLLAALPESETALRREAYVYAVDMIEQYVRENVSSGRLAELLGLSLDALFGLRDAVQGPLGPLAPAGGEGTDV